MYKLGVIYEQGLGEWFADKNRAFQYFRMAADMEHPEAIFKVGEFYENGLGSTPKDEKQALSWFKRGVELGHVPSLVKIGLFHENGQGGLARDTESALTCYLRCADKGNAEAQYRAARIYEQKMLAETRQNKVYFWGDHQSITEAAFYFSIQPLVILFLYMVSDILYIYSICIYLFLLQYNANSFFFEAGNYKFKK